MKVIKDLLLAMLNATLILVALCLFLAWQVSNSAGQVAERFAGAIVQISPLKDEAVAIRSEVVGLREDLANLRTLPSNLTASAQTALEDRISALNARVEAIDTRIAELDQIPERAAIAAVDHAANRMNGFVSSYSSCEPAS